MLYKKDLPDGLDLGNIIAVDTETMGLNQARDRLCLVQLSSGDGNAHLVQIQPGQTSAPNLKRALEGHDKRTIFHFARFDLAALKRGLDITCENVYCTRTASKLVRTYTDKHGLRHLCRELLNVEINKQQQCSDWGIEDLSEEQKEYAANDVLYLHALKEKLHEILVREKRDCLAQRCFDFLPTRAELDIAGFAGIGFFDH